MTEARRGIVAMVLACTIFGFSPIYFNALSHVPAAELLAHRVIWSLALFLAVLAAQRKLPDLVAILRPASVGRVAAAALMISTNWLLFVTAVNRGHVVQASLGYYIFPLMSVLIGVALFGERLRRLQMIAVALAAAAVAALTIRLGQLPVLSLGIAATMAAYLAVKKGQRAAPVTSVAAEMAVLLPAALLWMVLRPGSTGAAQPLMGSGWTPILLVGTSLMTAVPLMLMAFASQRLGLVTVGLMQYLNPTLQFLVATLWLREPFGTLHLLAFALIWLALLLYTASAMGGRRGLPKGAARL